MSTNGPAPAGTALITGATSGIGLELAKHFAKAHGHLVIVGHNRDRLKEAQAILRGLGAASVTPIEADLSTPEGLRIVIADVKDHDRDIEVLVNAAGAGEFGLFAETDLGKELAILQLNIASLVHLTKHFVPHMLGRGEGRILNVASIASYQPSPRLAVYAASKAFVLSFSDALREELSATSVHVTALIPGPTDTDFFRKAGMEHTEAAHNAEQPDVVARIGFEALMRGDAHAVAPGMRRLILMSSLMSNERIAALVAEQMEPTE